MEPPFLAGALTHFTVPQLLRLIQSSRVTGRLELKRSDERIDLFVETGKTLFARSTGASLRVGDVLVGRGEVRPEAIEFVLAMQQDRPGERIGRMLVDSGALTEEQIREAVLAVQRHIVIGSMLWREGTFRFVPDETIEGEEVRLHLDVDGLLASIMILAGDICERFGRREAA
jgi:hypothetical protein